MALNTQITDLVGGTIDTTACNQWANDACKEIINGLPFLRDKCSTVTSLTDGNGLDIDGFGQILHVTRLSANSGGFHLPCRAIPSSQSGKATDSTDLNYFGTATDPVFWVHSNASDAVRLFIKPDPDGTQVGTIYHVSYPSINVASDSAIANFPDEAEYLVILYVAAKQAAQYMTTEADNEDSELYQLYSNMYATFNAEYQNGLAILKGA